ncbi:unnamed protein product, partial [Closterium sp. Naga37s-1]
EEHLQQYLPEGLPPSMEKEFEASKSRAILLRAATKDFIHKLQAARDHQSSSSDSNSLVEPTDSPEGKVNNSSPGSFLLRGHPGSGKTCLLLTSVLWARANGWLVFYVPKARKWTNNGLYYKHPETEGEEGGEEGGRVEDGGEGRVGGGGRRKAIWDTPVQAQAALKSFLAAHQELLSSLPVQLPEPITLGEGPGIGLARGSQVVSPGSDWSLGDLVKYGADHSHAATSVVVRLREELGRVTSVPTMIAVDEFNAWFTFAGYFESTGDRSRRQIHAGEMRMVSAFRPLQARGIMAAAFSESIAVGKLPAVLPGVPKGVRVTVPRFTVDETLALLQHYQKSCKLGRVTDNEEDIKEAAVAELRRQVAANPPPGFPADLIVVSPLLRTLQTAVGAFGPPNTAIPVDLPLKEAASKNFPVVDGFTAGINGVEAVVPATVVTAAVTAEGGNQVTTTPPAHILANELCRETLHVHVCDKRRPIREKKGLFPSVDFSQVKEQCIAVVSHISSSMPSPLLALSLPPLPSPQPLLYHTSISPASLLPSHKLLGLKEHSKAVVSHSGFLHAFATVGLLILLSPPPSTS